MDGWMDGQLSEPGTPLDWTGVTTNSEECSYSSESRSESDDENETSHFPHVSDIFSDELAFVWESHGVRVFSSTLTLTLTLTLTVIVTLLRPSY